MSKKIIKDYFCYTKNAIISKMKLLLSGAVIAFGLAAMLLITSSWVEPAITFASFVMFCIVILSTFMDFTFLHKREEINYYLAKPTTLWGLVKKNLFANLVLWFIVTVVFVSLGVLFTGDDFGIRSILNVILAFSNLTLLLILSIALASLLTTSVLSSLLASMVVFALPLIMTVMLSTHVNLVLLNTIGFAGNTITQDLTGFLMEKLYVIDLYRMFDYRTVAIDFGYLLNRTFFFIATMAVLYAGLRVVSKSRRNENTSQGFSFDFVQTFLTITVAAFFSGLVAFGFGGGIIDQFSTYITYAIGFYLVYFVATMVLDLSFKITKKMVKTSTISIIIVIVLVIALNSYTDSIGTKLPRVESVEAVEVSTYSGYELFHDDGVTYSDSEDIQIVYALHKIIVENKSSHLGTYKIVGFRYDKEFGMSFSRSFKDESHYYSEEALPKNVSNVIEVIRNDESMVNAIVDAILKTPDSMTLSSVTYHGDRSSIFKEDDIEGFLIFLKDDLIQKVANEATLEEIGYTGSLRYGRNEYIFYDNHEVYVELTYTKGKRKYQKYLGGSQEDFNNILNYINTK